MLSLHHFLIFSSFYLRGKSIVNHWTGFSKVGCFQKFLSKRNKNNSFRFAGLFGHVQWIKNLSKRVATYNEPFSQRSSSKNLHFPLRASPNPPTVV